MACQTTLVETDAVHALTALVKRSRRRQRAALLGGTKTAATPVSPAGNDVDAKPAAPPACSGEPSLQDGIASWCSLREVFGDRCRMVLDDESKGEVTACISPVDVTQVLRVCWWGCKALTKAFTRPCVLVPVSGNAPGKLEQLLADWRHAVACFQLQAVRVVQVGHHLSCFPHG